MTCGSTTSSELQEGGVERYCCLSILLCSPPRNRIVIPRWFNEPGQLGTSCPGFITLIIDQYVVLVRTTSIGSDRCTGS